MATDETTGRLLGDLLRPLEHGEAVFDSAHTAMPTPLSSRDIVTPPQLLKKFPGDVVQAAAGRAQQAMDVGEADIAAVYMPATVGQAPFVLICDRKGAVACALRPDLTDAAIANNILDLVRRRTLGPEIHLRHHPVPSPDTSIRCCWSPRAGQTRGDTTRFSLRRRRSGGRSSFEPMLDFDTAAIPKSMMQDAAAAAVAASMGEDNPKQDTQTDTARPARPVPDNAADVAAAAHAAAEQSWNSNSPKGSITFENADPPQGCRAAGFCHKRCQGGCRLPCGPQRRTASDPHPAGYRNRHPFPTTSLDSGRRCAGSDQRPGPGSSPRRPAGRMTSRRPPRWRTSAMRWSISPTSSRPQSFCSGPADHPGVPEKRKQPAEAMPAMDLVRAAALPGYCATSAARAWP